MSAEEIQRENDRGPTDACCEECAREGRSGPQPLTLNLRPPRKNTRRYPVTPWSAQRLYRPFVRWALVIGIFLGFATGAGMLLMRFFDVPLGTWWVTHAQSHGVAQVFGFAGLFTMGVAFHVIPRFRNGPMRYPVPQRVILVAMILGIALRFGGQSISSYPAVSGPLVVLSGLLMLIAIAGFVGVAGSALASGKAKRTPTERWLALGMAWLLLAGSIQMALSVRMALDQTVIAHGPWNNALIIAGLLGFLGCFIFGVSTRTVTGFLGLKHQRQNLELAGFVLFNGGVGWLTLTTLYGAPAATAQVGSMFVAAGALAFVFALRIFERSVSNRNVMPGAYAHYTWFIRAAYGWLVVYASFTAIEAIEVIWAVSILPAPDTRPTIHLLTLGFITSMIIGMASRMIPLFEGSVIRGHRFLDAAWVMLVGSVGLRIVFGFVRPGADAWLAISGLMGFLAICVFAVLLLDSITRRSREQYRQAAAEIGRVRWKAAST